MCNVENLKLRVSGPLAIQGSDQLNISENLTLNLDIEDFKRQWHEFNLAQGSIVTIIGEFVFRSEKPAECMVVAYSKEA